MRPFGDPRASARSGDDAVAVHRLIQVGAGDEDVAGDASSGRSGTTKPKPRGLVWIRPTTRFIRGPEGRTGCPASESGDRPRRGRSAGA